MNYQEKQKLFKELQPELLKILIREEAKRV